MSNPITLVESVVLGVVQGVTEFLPISSTAHLRVVPALLGWADPGAAYSAVIQIGTVCAVLLYFRRELWAMAAGILKGLRSGKPMEDPHGRLGIYIALGTIPIVIFGLTLEKWIKTSFRSLYVIAFALVVVGIIMGIADRRAKRRADGDQVTLTDSLLIGLAQCLALVPGVSRSGSTITAGLMRGMDRAEAARFSFLLSIPAVTAAGLKELKEILQGSSAEVAAMFPQVVVGTVVSFVVGYFAIAGLIAFLKNNSVRAFVVYRVGLGLTLLVLLYTGYLGAQG